MEMWDIDKQVNIYIQNEEYDKAERLLLEQYAELKIGGNPTAISHILYSLAMFYRLPFKQNFAKAESYYREMETTFPGWESDLRMASFYFYALRDFTKTAEKVQAMGKLEDQDGRDIQFYYSALTLRGQALLYLNPGHEAAMTLQELGRIIASAPKRVPYGDEFNFLDEMAQRKLEPELCSELANVIAARISDQEFKEKYSALLKQLGSGSSDVGQ